MNAMLVVVICIFVLFMIIGFVRGFVKSVLKLIFMGLAVVISYFVAPIVGDLIIEHTKIDDKIQKNVQAKVEKIVEDKIKREMSQSLGVEIESIDKNLLEQVKTQTLTGALTKKDQIKFIQGMELPEHLEKGLLENNTKDIKQEYGVDSFYEYVVCYITRMVVKAMAFVISFVIFGILFSLLYSLILAVAQLPILHGINKLGGVIVGFGEALLIVWIIFVIAFNAPENKFCSKMVSQVNENSALTFIQNHNIVSDIANNIKE